LYKFGKASAKTRTLLEKAMPAIISPRPASLGFPGPNAQSNYYPGPEILSRQEIVEITKVLEDRSIEPENTRIQKSVQDGQVVYNVLQGSTETGSEEITSQIVGADVTIRVMKGDYADVLRKVCASLSAASEYAATDSQRAVLDDYIRSFTTGSLDAYRDSQKKWVVEKEPVIENIFGFVEQYHDPQGVRAEFQGLVAVADPAETAIFKRFVNEAPKFLRMLPWAAGTTENDGKGPFEKTSFEAPEFTSIHGEIVNSSDCKD
jgi:dipeptidyl-peptidase-3